MGERKNKAMRAATTLMAGVLLSTSVLSGTMAKYVSGWHGDNDARVAKFGVSLLYTGTMFAKSYVKADATSALSNEPQVWSLNAESVSSEPKEGDDTKGDSNVVAPGTKSKPGGVRMRYLGKAEVSTKAAFRPYWSNDSQVQSAYDIFINSGSYYSFTKLTSAEAEIALSHNTGNNVYYKTSSDTLELASETDPVAGTEYYMRTSALVNTGFFVGYANAYGTAGEYHPLQYTVTGTTNTVQNATMKAALKEIQNTVNAGDGGSHAPGYIYNSDFSVTWQWPFNRTTNSTSSGDADTATQTWGIGSEKFTLYNVWDAADTMLGILMAQKNDTNQDNNTIIAINENNTYKILKVAQMKAYEDDTKASAWGVYVGDAPSSLYKTPSTSAPVVDIMTPNSGVKGCLNADFAVEMYVCQVD